jgi:hypothetical protein
MRSGASGRRQRVTRWALLGLVLGGAGLAGEARAVNPMACTAADVVAQNGTTCPSGTGPCTVSIMFDVGDNCVLDFRPRDVTIAASGQFNIGSGSVTILAKNFTVAPGGMINGTGVAGGFLQIEATANVAVQKSGSPIGIIDVSGTVSAGTMQILAGGTVSVTGGQLLASGTTAEASGGAISIDAGVDIITMSLSRISADAGVCGFPSGAVSLTAQGRINLGDRINIEGADGGSLTVSADNDVVVSTVRGNSIGPAGSGGCVDINGKSVQLLGLIEVDGGTSIDGAGCGGAINVSADFGDLTIANDLTARGPTPDGGGGCITLTSAGSTTIQSGRVVTARSTAQGCGGEICVTAGGNVTSNGSLDVSAGSEGGMIDIDATGNVTLSGGTVDASGFDPGSAGGSITVTAGDVGQGALSIATRVDAGGAGCLDPTFCGIGGFTDLAGCDLTVTSTGHVLARGADGGDNALTAHEQLKINGEVRATRIDLGDPTQLDGTNTFNHPSRKPAIVTGAVAPAATDTAFDTCTAPGQEGLGLCLDPCPICGNGITEFPETCDNNVGTPLSCDGCSWFCQTEDCDDRNVCTVDMCDPHIGCLSLLILRPTPCLTPTLTPTITLTPTVTQTPTKTATPSNSPTPSITPTPTATRPPAIDIGIGVGRPGGIACAYGTLAGGAGRVATTSNDIGFDPNSFSMSGCTINPAVGAGTTANKQLNMTPLSPGVEQVSIAGNTNLIPDGSLYGCAFGIGAAVGAGTYPLANTAAAFDTAGQPIGVTGTPGQLVVTSCTGDCDGNARVSIGEVIRCVNLFLGQPVCNFANPALSCPVADVNLNGTVTIGEVTQCVNRFLLGC